MRQWFYTRSYISQYSDLPNSQQKLRTLEHVRHYLRGARFGLLDADLILIEVFLEAHEDLSNILRWSQVG